MQLILPPLIRREQIRHKVSELAEKICKDIDVENLCVIVILKGAVFFATDLLRELPPVASIDFIRAESYQGCNSSGKVKMFDNHIPDVKGKKVLLIEDIFDTGLTTQKVVDYLREQSPKDIYLCVLLEKKKYRKGITISSDYVGFYIEDNFVVGYGMDYDGKFRNLPDIHILALDKSID